MNDKIALRQLATDRAIKYLPFASKLGESKRDMPGKRQHYIDGFMAGSDYAAAEIDRLRGVLAKIRDNHSEHLDDDFDNRLHRVRTLARVALADGEGAGK